MRCFAKKCANATLSGIDPRSHALLRIAALIAMDAAPPSYMSAVQAGLKAGASYDEIVGTLIAVMPIVGVARVVSAAPNLGSRSATTSPRRSSSSTASSSPRSWLRKGWERQPRRRYFRRCLH